MLDIHDIISGGQQAAPTRDTDPESIHRNLAALLNSINAEAGLSAVGKQITRGQLVKRECDRLSGLRWTQDNPEILGETIAEPLFLLGLPRSGTTALQYLFDRDPRFRLIRTWEASDPLPPPGADPEAARLRKESEAERVKLFPLPEGFGKIHLIDLDGPEECHTFLEYAYAAAGFFNMMMVPSYFDYLLGELYFEDAYRVHKRHLQLSQWKRPKRRWALKYPNHLLALDAMVKVYPDARFVMTHRDPVQAVASLANLTWRLSAVRQAEPADPATVGRYMFRFIAEHVDRLMAFVQGPDADRIKHVDYYRMVREPGQVMREINKAIGLDLPPETEAEINHWHDKNPKGARGANPYTLEQFGLNEAEVVERLTPYMRHFDIPREQAGTARKVA